jgi:hypothetical protein
METQIHNVRFRPSSIGNSCDWVEPSSRSLAFYFGDICYSEFSRKRSFLSDLGFGLKRACIRTGGHPRRGESSAWPSRPESPRTGWRVVKRTLLLASKFTETPGCNVTLCRIHDLGRTSGVGARSISPCSAADFYARQPPRGESSPSRSSILRHPKSASIAAGSTGTGSARSWLGSILRLSENF